MRRKQRLQLRWITVAGAVLNEGVRPGQPTFGHLVEADFVLWLRSALDPSRAEYAREGWYPRLLAYAEDVDTFEVFGVRRPAPSLTGSGRYSAPIAEMSSSTGFRVVLGSGRLPEEAHVWGGPERYARLVNLDALGTR
jgi:hypothetical protein